MKPKFVLTFDLEFWHNSHFLKPEPVSGKKLPDGQIEKATLTILKILKKNRQQATFFILGSLAEQFPELIKKIHKEGHEIASHGYSHVLLNCADKEFPEKEICLAVQALEKAIGQKPEGFRAPCFSLDCQNSQAWACLKKNGLKYDSSLHPLKSFQAPPDGFREIPCSLGGFYFRLLPLPLFLFLAKFLAKTETPVVYLHPHELFEFSPKISSGPWWKRKIKYWGSKTALKKFERMSKNCEFISIKQYLKNTSSS